MRRPRATTSTGAATRAPDSSTLQTPKRTSRAPSSSCPRTGQRRRWLGHAQGAVEDLSFAIDTSAQPDRITAWAYHARGLAYAALGDTQHACRLPSYLSLSPEANDRALVETWIVDLS
jgi:hypothetical protein